MCVCVWVRVYVRMLSARRLMSFSVDVVFISSSWLLFSFFFPFLFRFGFFFGFFWRFNFLMISQIAYFLHDAGCQQLHPCLCHFLCVCMCVSVWVSLDTQNSDGNNDDNNEVLQRCWGFFSSVRWGGVDSLFAAHALKFRHMTVCGGEGGGISEVGTQAWSYFAYLYWHVQVDFLCPKMSAIHRQL